MAKATEVLEAIADGSPFALLRAIELAQLMHEEPPEALSREGSVSIGEPDAF